MKKLFYFLTIILVPFHLSAQVSQEWVARYEGPGDNNDEASEIAIDQSGNAYITGKSEQGMLNYDYATIKYDPYGNDVWIQRYNGPENQWDYGVSIAVNALGDAYVVGLSFDKITSFKYSTVGLEMWMETYSQCTNAASLALDNLENVYVTGSGYVTGTSGNEYTTIKYNHSGVELWVRRYGGPDSLDDNAYSIATDDLGNVYVTGASRNFFNYDYATVKYNTDGDLQWAQRFNGPNDEDDIAHSIAVDDSGNVYVTGESEGSGYATLKYNTNGVLQWVKTLGGSNGDAAYSIAVDDSRNVYVTGGIFFSATSLDYTTVKYSSTGSQMWISRYNGPAGSIDVAYSLALDGSGNVYVTGGSSDTSYDDCATVKYNSNGSEIWVQRYNGPGNGVDQGKAIAVDASGNVYVTGGSYGNGTKTDYVTIKYSQPVSVEQIISEIPDNFYLYQNYPNPFNPITMISYQLPVRSYVTLKVYDILGDEIATLVDEYKPAGSYEVEFSTSSHSALSGIKELSSGVYFYQLKAGDFIQTKKMLYLK